MTGSTRLAVGWLTGGWCHVTSRSSGMSGVRHGLRSGIAAPADGNPPRPDVVQPSGVGLENRALVEARARVDGGDRRIKPKLHVERIERSGDPVGVAARRDFGRGRPESEIGLD